MRYEVWSESRGDEDSPSVTQHETTRTSEKAAKEDADLLRLMGKRTWISETND